MTKAIKNMRTMTARGILSRELRELAVGDVLIVPFKYCTANNIKVNVSNMRSEGLDFEYDNTGTENSVIRRTR